MPDRYPDPSLDPDYCDGLSDPSTCPYCGDRIAGPWTLDDLWAPYCSSLCAHGAEIDSLEDTALEDDL